MECLNYCNMIRILNALACHFLSEAFPTKSSLVPTGKLGDAKALQKVKFMVGPKWNQSPCPNH